MIKRRARIKPAPKQRTAEEIRGIYHVMEGALEGKLSAITTPIKGKKVFLDEGPVDIDHSRISTNDKSEEGGYMHSGYAFKIPDNVNRIRFFVYWNDKERVDVDLHAGIVDRLGHSYHIGWNDDFRSEDAAFSGDITHSDAAEYIDVDLSSERIGTVNLNINLFSGKRSFGDIETCFTGIMAVDKIGKHVKLYDPKNCFFSHVLTGKESHLQYGYIDAVNRCLIYEGNPENCGYAGSSHQSSVFTLRTYLDILFKAQGCTVVDDRDDADVVLVMGKASGDRELSLPDNNLFMDL